MTEQRKERFTDIGRPWRLVVEADAAYIFHEGGLAAVATSFPPGPPNERHIKALSRLVEDANMSYKQDDD